MSNFDSTWTERLRDEAANEGWELGLVVDEGKPVQAAYLDIFQVGQRFTSRRAAMLHVRDQATKRSQLHIAALTLCSASRVEASMRSTQRKRK